MGGPNVLLASQQRRDRAQSHPPVLVELMLRIRSRTRAELFEERVCLVVDLWVRWEIAREVVSNGHGKDEGC
jgi:hypothetical protein